MADGQDETKILVMDGRAQEALQFEQILSPDGMKSLENILFTYSQYGGGSFADSPGDRAETYESTHEDFSILVKEFIRLIKEKYLSKSELLKEDPFNIIADILEKLGHQAYGTEEAKSNPVNIAALRLRAHMFSYLIYQIVLKESSYRKTAFQKKTARAEKEAKLVKLRKLAGDRAKAPEFWRLYRELEKDPEITLRQQQGGFYSALNSPQAINEDLFTLMDNPTRVPQGVSPSRLGSLTVSAATFTAIKIQAEFFQKESQNFNAPRQHPDALKSENDRVFELIKRDSTRGIPLCTCDNKTLLKNSRIVMQILPVAQSSGEIFEDSVAQINYHGKNNGEKVKRSRALQESFGTHQIGGVNINIAGGNSPTAYYLNRSNGEIRTMSIYPETLKLIAGSRAYELLRRDILFYVAQLTCKPETLNEIFGKDFLLTPPAQAPQGSAPALPAGQKKPYKERKYPYGLPDDPAIKRATAIFTVISGGQAPIMYLTPDIEIEADTPMSPAEVARAIENTKRMIEEGEIVHHKRLLPLIKRKIEEPEGVRVEILGSFEPSEKAIERARENGKILRKGIEFPHRDEIFYPDQIPDLLQVFGCATVEELAEKYPNEAYIRYETWVDPEETRKERLKKSLEGGSGAEITEIVRATTEGSTEASETTFSKPSGPRPIIAKFRAVPPKEVIIP